MSFCENLKNPIFEIPKCKILDLRNTSIEDEIFNSSLLNQSIEILFLSNCNNLKKPKIKCEKLKELYLGCCLSLEENCFSNEEKFNCPNLKILDLQITNVKFDELKFPELKDIRT